jgi:hypothetical protein
LFVEGKGWGILCLHVLYDFNIFHQVNEVKKFSYNYFTDMQPQVKIVKYAKAIMMDLFLPKQITKFIQTTEGFNKNLT